MAKTPRVLIAEDECAIAESIRSRLERDGEFAAETAATALDALHRLAARLPDVLLLDTTLPDLSAREMCRLLRSRRRTAHLPCILLGERAGGVGAVEGLELGADDYMSKPLDPHELRARVRAVLRRRARQPESPADRFDGAHISADFGAAAVSIDGITVSLTLREFRLLRALIGARNQVLSREALLADAWESDARDCRVVDSAVWKLRTKLGSASDQIETVVGFGYRFNEPEA